MREGLHDLSPEAFHSWLRDEVGLQEYRRIVRDSDSIVVISKFEPGFSQELFATVDLLPELFDDSVVEAEYERLVQEHRSQGAAPLRTAVWRQASEAVLHRFASERGIDERRRMFVLPGIESVQAVMDSILWSAPTIEPGYQPRAGELEAYREFESALERGPPSGPGRDIFTRFYGVYEGRPVENYCPGAPFGRRLVSQAWRLCTAQL